MTVQGNLEAKRIIRNERWATGLVYAHLITNGLLSIGGLIDTFLRKTISPLLCLAIAELPIVAGSIVNAAGKYSQVRKISGK